jgi:[acyl-carrier-protein] S-malonyltransferase
MSGGSSAGRRRVVVLCPGRGSYGAADLGSLSRALPAASRDAFQAVLAATDARRAAAGDPTLSALDGSERLTAAHSAGQHVSPLIFACTAAEFLRLDRQRCHVVAVAGNSLGWYSALFCAGALTLTDTMRLVETMSGMNRDGLIGGQLVYPVTDERWLADHDLAERVDAALGAARAAGAAIIVLGLAPSVVG